jgi:hypothetical protein
MSALAASCSPPADPATGWRHPAPDPNPDPESDLYKNVTDLATPLSRTNSFCLVRHTVPRLKDKHRSILCIYLSILGLYERSSGELSPASGSSDRLASSGSRPKFTSRPLTRKY